MHLIAALAAGVQGASEGSVQIFARGTTQPATVYSDPYGTVMALPSTGAFALDVNGGLVCYVNQEVDVVVSASNAPVRSWTEMAEAPNVEVVSQSFTGADYVTGQTGQGLPTTLQKALDGWVTSAGAGDFNVLLNGVKTPLLTAFGKALPIYVNVKDPAYGAFGDGVHDDTIAVQAAITAAAALPYGATVFFPTGNYKITNSVTCNSTKVNLLGAGRQVTTISNAASSGVPAFTFPNSTTASVFAQVSDLAIANTTSTAGSAIVINGGGSLCCRSCNLGSTVATALAVSASADCVLIDCNLAVSSTSYVTSVQCNGTLTMLGGSVTTPAGAWSGNAISANTIKALGVSFNDQATGGSFTWIGRSTLATLSGSVSGCNVSSTAGATVYFVDLGHTTSSTFVEQGNAMPTNVTPYVYTGTGGPMRLDARRSYQTNAIANGVAGSTVTVDCLNGGHSTINILNGNAFVIALNGGHEGAILDLELVNNQAGASGSVTFALPGPNYIAAFTVGAGKARRFQLYFQNSGGWLLLDGQDH